jgi:putative PIN family toxin of toxin-antitoxin system
MRPGIVMDTNVLIAGLRSKRGASHQLLRLVGTGVFDLNLSVPLVLEYEAVGKRQAPELGLNLGEIDAVVDYLCSVGEHREIFFLWRPMLRDSGDDFVLELAVECSADYLVTFNKRDFVEASQFGLKVVSPREFLEELGGEP